MAYKKYNSSNNAFAAFNLPIADTDVTCVLKWKYSRFPTWNFIMKATHVENGVVTGRENIYVTTRSGATCNGLVRAYEPVPVDDDATTNIQQALNFSADDIVEVVVSSEFLKDMQEEIDAKLAKSGWLRTWFWANKHIVLNRTSGAEESKNVTDTSNPSESSKLRFEKADWNFEDATFLSIKNGLSTVWKYTQTVQMGEDLPTPWYWSNVINTFATSGSHAGTYTVMWGRVQFAQRTKIVSAKYPHNASNWSAAIVITMGESPFTVLWTYPVANGTKEATGINFVCEPWVIYQIGCNSTANFGNLHANYTLTAADIAKGFISGCYANANFDTTWRMQEVVAQTEYPVLVPIAIVNNVTYLRNNPLTQAWSFVNRGIVFDNAFVWRQLWIVKTPNVTSSASGIIKLQDSTGADIATRTLASGANSVDFNGTVIWTNYRLVVNDSVHWSSTSYYDTVANWKSQMPFVASGITNWTADNTNAFMFSEININYWGKWYKAFKNSIQAEFDFYLKFAGFTTWPKATWDSVSLTNTQWTVVSWFSGLVDTSLYFLSSVPWVITLSPTTDGFRIWKAFWSQNLEIDMDLLKYTDATFNTIWSAYLGAYPYPPANSHICRVLKKWTLRLTTQTGVNGWNVTGTRLTSVLKNWVSVYSSWWGAWNFDFACDANDIFIITWYAFQEAWSWSLWGWSITIALNDLTRTSKYVTL